MGLFKTYSEKQIKKITSAVDKIEALEDSFKAMSDGEMREYTDKLKASLKGGAKLEDILPQAFALVREADRRVLGKRPFRVQLMGGILLHQGRIAEMKTGEGKTLVATLPAYLNALTEKGVHIVTVNDYLATRDSEEMGRVFSFLGLSTGLVVAGQSPEEKRNAYAADITYGTNNEFGFDYLRDNMVVYSEHMVQRGHNFAIVDEVDSILIDEARTPLIISGEGAESTELYTKTDECVKKFAFKVIKEIDTKVDNDKLYKDFDYIVDEKARTAVLTERGIEKAEKFFGINDLSITDDDENGENKNSEILHHLNIAIRARGVMKKDVDYIVKDGQVIIVDTFTGRLMPGRRYNDGLHQAIEAKENVIIQKESRTVATVTFQNYFRLYNKLSGMTGTALTEDDEFRDIYALDVVEVPTNNPMIREDHNDVVFRTYGGKISGIIKQIKECREKGQPVLVGTVSIDKSEALSAILKRNKIPHNVLNAKHHEKEAEIVAQAGRLGAVTISTNMAGRGTDILLGGNPEFMAKEDMRKLGYSDEAIYFATGSAASDNSELLSAREEYQRLCEKHKQEIAPEAEKVREAGGLFILGTERHESRRIDNQLRGRSGRQGDPGASRFFLSLEDDLFRIFADKLDFIVSRLGKYPEDMPLADTALFSKTVETAQKRIESGNFARRRNVLTYDDIMNQQRKMIYEQRREVLFEESISEKIQNMIYETVGIAFDEYLLPEDANTKGFKAQFDGLITDKHGLSYTDEELRLKDRDEWREEILESAIELYDSKNELFKRVLGIPFTEIEKNILLRTVDERWMQHLDDMDELKEYVGLNSYAQRDPVTMYRIQSAELFEEMVQDIRESTVRRVLSARPKPAIVERKQTVKNTRAGFADGRSASKGNGGNAQRAVSEKIDRNAKCPCGSGLKYKKCCLLKNNTQQ